MIDLKFYDNSKTWPKNVWNILKNVPGDMQIEFEKMQIGCTSIGPIYSFTQGISESHKFNSRGNVRM